MDPVNGFALQTSNFCVAIAPINVADWAFDPTDGQLYSIRNNGLNPQTAIKINPITGAITTLTTTGVPLALTRYGRTFFDSTGNLYAINNDTGGVYRIVLTTTTATGTLFSQAIPSVNNDGARCPLAALDMISVVKPVEKTTARLGDTITYTITIANNSQIAVTCIVLTDPIPAETVFVPGSRCKPYSNIPSCNRQFCA